MKKLIFLILTVVTVSFMQAQPTCTSTARSYVNSQIISNGIRSITAPKLNTALNYIITAINCNDSLSSKRVDSVKVINDSLYVWNHVGGLVKQELPSGGGGGTTYLEGYGISISGDSIYVDTTVISSKAYSASILLAKASIAQLNDSTSALNTRISAKQSTLVSGTNIKTVNSTTLLGSGNLPINLGVVYRADSIRLYVIGGIDTTVFGYAVRNISYSSDTLRFWQGDRYTAYYIGGGGGGSVSISDLTDATANHTISLGAYKTVLTANSITGDSAFIIKSNSTAAASNLQNLLTVWQSGNNSTSSQTTYAARFINNKGGTTGINIGAYFEALNGATNYAVDVLGDLRMNANSNIRMSPGAQIFQTSGSGINFNSTTQGIKYNGTGYMDYYGGSVQHLFTSTNVNPFSISSTAGVSLMSFTRPAANQYSIVFNGDFFGSGYRGETTTSNVINSASGILKFAANTGNAGGFASFTPNYVLSIKPTTAINLTPITATAASAITPAEGDMVFVSDTNGTFTSIGFWGYQNGTWTKM